MNKVSVVNCESYSQKEVDKAVRKSLELIGFNALKPKKILIKPNVLGAYKPEEAVTTHPSVIKAVCKIFPKSKIYIGDSSGIEATTLQSLEKSGIKKAAEECGAELISFDSAKLVKLKTDYSYLKEIYVPKILFEVGMIISVSKMKTHGFTFYTGALKNLFGCIPGGQKTKLHATTKTCEEFSRMIVELNKVIKPKLHIMDAVVGMEGAGPSAGSPKKTGLMLSSENAAALDYIASGIMGFKPMEVPMVRIAKEEIPFEAELVGKEAIVDYKKLFGGGFIRFIPRPIVERVMKRKIVIDRKKCRKCMACFKHCPAHAISKDITIDEKKCIRCFCCQELCPYHAISIKSNIALQAYAKVGAIKRKIFS